MNISAQKGMALLVVMLMTATLAALAAGLSSGWTSQAARTRVMVTSLEAYWMMAGAENVLIAELSRQQEIFPRKGIITVDGNPINYVLRDKGNCFNINSLLAAGQQKEDGSYHLPYARRVFVTLLNNFGLTEASARNVMNQLLMTVKVKPDAPSTRSFSHVSALFPVEGMSYSQQKELRKLLCIAPDARLSVNINTLKPRHAPLFAALFTGSLSVSDAGRLLAERPASGWDKPQALAGLLGPDAEKILNDVATAAVTSLQEAELLLWMQNEELHLLLSRLTKTDIGLQVRDRQTLLSEENIDAINETHK